MGYRLSKIYTKTGDQGETALSDNKRIPKNSLIIETIGQLDHLNASIGVVIAFSTHTEINQILTTVQQHLFNIGGQLSYPQFSGVSAADVTWLESVLDQLNGKLPPIKEFILPGGSEASALCHQARTIARALERTYVSLMQSQVHKNPIILQYLNRLSDLLFVLARSLNLKDKHQEILWESPKTQKAKEAQ